MMMKKGSSFILFERGKGGKIHSPKTLKRSGMAFSDLFLF
jgi:hypothetical protein